MVEMFKDSHCTVCGHDVGYHYIEDFPDEIGIVCNAAPEHSHAPEWCFAFPNERPVQEDPQTLEDE